MSEWWNPDYWLRQAPDPLNLRGLAQGAAAEWVNEVLRLAEGRDVEFRTAGRPTIGTVRRLTATPAPPDLLAGLTGQPEFVLVSGHAVLGDVRWDNRSIERLEVVAADIHIASALNGGAATVRATVGLDEANSWLSDSDVELVGPGKARGDVAVRYQWRRLTVSAEVSVRATRDAVVFVIRSATVRGRQMKLPARFNLALNVPLELPAGVRLRDIEVRGEDAVVELEVTSFSYPIGPDQVIEALRQRGERAVFDVS